MADTFTTIANLIKMGTGDHDNDWGLNLNNNFDALEAMIKSAREVATTGGTTTLSQTQAREGIQRVTGTLASNAIIEVPNLQSHWYFINETTGAFSVTVKVSGQTGVVIPQGSAMWLRGNGTDVTAVIAATPKGQDQYATAVGGTVDAITITTVPALTRIRPGAQLSWISPGKNTITNPTLTPDGISALTIKKGASEALAVGDTGASGHQCHGIIAANGTDLILLNPALHPVPAGALSVYAGTTEPAGWLFCYGQAVSRSTYAVLFAVVGTTYGAGDGFTTFNLPDLRGRVVAGQDDMGGSSANRLTNQSGGLNGDTLGATGGSETHTLTEAQMPLHGHPWRSSINGGSPAASGGLTMDESFLGDHAAYTGSPSSTRGQQIGGTGGGAAHNNVQPTIILNYIIKT